MIPYHCEYFSSFYLIIYACGGSVTKSGCFRERNKKEYTHPHQHGVVVLEKEIKGNTLIHINMDYLNRA